MEFQPYFRVVPGAAQAVLCIHGIVGTPTHFSQLLPLIPKNWSVYNILLDGHGKQVEDFSHTSMKKWKAQVANQVDEILKSHENVLIIAHSMGTLFAIEESIRRPESIAGLFLLNAALTPWVTPATWLNSLGLVFGKVRPNTSAADMLCDCGVHLTPKLWKYLGWIPRFYELLVEARRTKGKLSCIAVPCQVFQSKNDELVSRRTCRLLQAHPHIQLTELEDSGHFAYKGKDLELLKTALSRLIEEISA